MIKNSFKLFITAVFLMAPFVTSAQKPNWQNLDLEKDSVFGISTERAYKELLIKKKPKPVIVAVIDSGVDSLHEDLTSVLWKSRKDRANNGKDDDRNGYQDDNGGWSFIGSAKGNVSYDNLELVRLIREEKAYFENKDTLALQGQELEAYQSYKEKEEKLRAEIEEAQQTLMNIAGFGQILDNIMVGIGKEDPSVEDLRNFTPENELEEKVRAIVLQQMENYTSISDFKKEQIDRGIEYFKGQLNFQLNLSFDPRDIVGDDYKDSTERFYGSKDYTGPDALHGTHVAGIIAADRSNDVGIKGVANNVKVLPIRAVPDGDERDKDVANAIRYAVDQGAKVINMSFGKAYSSDKAVVDAAIQYAMENDVLLVHAAGNDNKNLDLEKNFPTRSYAGSGQAAAWLEVGASGYINDKTLKAPFSNYGKTTVDVFAPGVQINSTVPGSGYKEEQGTSMASPVVAGLAAVIRQYYPKLTALQVKEVIMESVVKVDQPVTLTEGDQQKEVSFADLCISGGIVNAYRALQLAETK